jgi:hypothetical protein
MGNNKKEFIMKSIIKLLGIVVIMATIVFSFIACGDNGDLSTPSHSHAWGNWTTKTAATCIAAEVQERTCTTDATHKETRTVGDPDPDNHDWGAWYEEIEATVTTDGKERRECQRDGCNAFEEETIIHHEHEYTVWATLTEADCYQAKVEKRTCTVEHCPHFETRNVGVKLEHDMDWVVTTASTYIAEGVETYKCKRIGCTHTEGTPRPVLRRAINSTAEFVTVVNGLTANPDPAAPYTLRLTLSDLGSAYNVSGSIVYTLSDYSTNYNRKRVILDMSGSSFISIQNNGLRSCLSLIGVIIPSTVTSIGNNAFSGNNNLASITIPNGVVTIGTSAFSNNRTLTTVTIPDSVTTIGDSAFSGCTALTVLNIGKGVTGAGMTFSTASVVTDCTALREINIDPANPAWSSIDGVAIRKNVSNIIAKYPEGKTAASYTIPTGVNVIGDYAFQNNKHLTSLILPANVGQIAGAAFSGCTTLASLTVHRETLLNLTLPVFTNGADPTVYVPANLVADYKAANYWKDSIIEAIP